jgi:hypothetical protein
MRVTSRHLRSGGLVLLLGATAYALAFLAFQWQVVRILRTPRGRTVVLEGDRDSAWSHAALVLFAPALRVEARFVRVIIIDVGDDAAWQSAACGLDYQALLQAARAGDAAGLDGLMEAARHTDGAGSEQLSSDLAELLDQWGDAPFARVMRRRDPEGIRLIQALCAYERLDADDPQHAQPNAYPETFAGYPAPHPASGEPGVQAP